ncbi:MAG: hypothetical protein N2201_02735 [candidate division WOR-3 bacterium]|nr:hypothetical protein [candidate division WOR-3 bacterium]
MSGLLDPFGGLICGPLGKPLGCPPVCPLACPPAHPSDVRLCHLTYCL